MRLSLDLFTDWRLLQPLLNWGWALERVAGILAFNMGIETMQLIVVAVTMPSLVLMSRTRAYLFLRIGGALFAGFASVGWIVERLLGVQSSVDVAVNSVAHHAVWIAGALFVVSVGCWWLRGLIDSRFVPADTLRGADARERLGVAVGEGVSV